jgi:DNA-binding transcriptional LysR family regulator
VGSFSRAAQMLGISQSGVSHAIKQLETELGVTLFLREGAAATVTEVGCRLLARANDILQQKEALQQEADAEQGMARGTLRIASFGATSSLRLLPQLLARYQSAHPLVEVQIEEATDDVVVQWLLERRVELGFVVLPDERFDTLPLTEDELVAVLPSAHPLAARSAVRAMDCMARPLSAPRPARPAHRCLSGAGGGVPRTLFRFEQLSSMMGFWRAGRRHCAAGAAQPPDGVVYRPLKPRRRSIALAALRFDKLSPAAAAFVETTRKARKHWVMD